MAVVEPTPSPTTTVEPSPSDTSTPAPSTDPPAPVEATFAPGTTVQVDPTSVQTVALQDQQFDFFAVAVLLLVFAAAAVLAVKL